MSLNPNQYSKLVAQGRAKAINVPWTEEEMAQITACVNPVDRENLIAKLRGQPVATTPTNVSKTEVIATPSKPFAEMNKEELKKQAKELSVKIPRGSTTEQIVALLEEAIKAK